MLLKWYMLPVNSGLEMILCLNSETFEKYPPQVLCFYLTAISPHCILLMMMVSQKVKKSTLYDNGSFYEANFQSNF